MKAAYLRILNDKESNLALLEEDEKNCKKNKHFLFNPIF